MGSLPGPAADPLSRINPKVHSWNIGTAPERSVYSRSDPPLSRRGPGLVPGGGNSDERHGSAEAHASTWPVGRDRARHRGAGAAQRLRGGAGVCAGTGVLPRLLRVGLLLSRSRLLPRPRRLLLSPLVAGRRPVALSLAQLAVAVGWIGWRARHGRHAAGPIPGDRARIGCGRELAGTGGRSGVMGQSRWRMLGINAGHHRRNIRE